MKEKPPILSEEQIDEAWPNETTAAREIFEAYDSYIESLGTDLNKLTQQTIKHEREHKAKIQSLKDKWLKEGK